MQPDHTSTSGCLWPETSNALADLLLHFCSSSAWDIRTSQSSEPPSTTDETAVSTEPDASKSVTWQCDKDIKRAKVPLQLPDLLDIVCCVARQPGDWEYFCHAGCFEAVVRQYSSWLQQTLKGDVWTFAKGCCTQHDDKGLAVLEQAPALVPYMCMLGACASLHVPPAVHLPLCCASKTQEKQCFPLLKSA